MKPFEESGYLPAKGNILISAELFFKSILSNINTVLFLMAVLGFLFYIYKNKFDNTKLIPYFTVSAFIVGILSLFFGQVVILLPNSFPSGYLNSRYGLIVLPFVIIFTIFAFNHFNLKKKFRIFSAIVILSTSVYWILNFPVSSGSVSEALYYDINRPELKRASVFLLREYDRTNILFDDNSINLYPYTKISMQERINTHTFYWGELSLKNPSKVVGWVIMDTKSGKDEVHRILRDNADFKSFFTMVHNDNGIEIYKRTKKTY
jgi:hypothetical protein